jgi:type I restriction enzyme, R subunit
VLFEDDGTLVKKLAGYHQFHAVRAAITRVIAVASPGGSQKGGVVWHLKDPARASPQPASRRA